MMGLGGCHQTPRNRLAKPTQSLKHVERGFKPRPGVPKFFIQGPSPSGAGLQACPSSIRQSSNARTNQPHPTRLRPYPPTMPPPLNPPPRPRGTQIPQHLPRGGVLRTELVVQRSIRLAQQIAGLLGLAQILEHRREIGLTDGDGGVAGLEGGLVGGQRLPQQIAGLRQLAQILEHRREIGRACPEFR